MSFGPGSGSSDPSGELLNRFFGMPPGSSPPAVQRVPIGRPPGESAHELIDSAARRAEQDGARPLRRTIQAEPDNRIASLLPGGEADPGDTIVADVEDNALRCTVRPKPAGTGGGTADDDAS